MKHTDWFVTEPAQGHFSTLRVCNQVTVSSHRVAPDSSNVKVDVSLWCFLHVSSPTAEPFLCGKIASLYLDQWQRNVATETLVYIFMTQLVMFRKSLPTAAVSSIEKLSSFRCRHIQEKTSAQSLKRRRADSHQACFLTWPSVRFYSEWPSAVESSDLYLCSWLWLFSWFLIIETKVRSP